MAAIHLNAADRRRLNGFQAKCLREIFGIKPSYYSRVSNQEVLRRTGHLKATELLERQQLALLGRVLRAPDGNPLRTSTLIIGTLQPATSRYVRRAGRPRTEWFPTMVAAAQQRTGRNLAELNDVAQDPKGWKKLIKA